MPTEQEVERLVCAIYPTKLEAAASWAVERMYGIAEGGPVGWLADRIDDLRVASIRRRADRNLARKATGNASSPSPAASDPLGIHDHGGEWTRDDHDTRFPSCSVSYGRPAHAEADINQAADAASDQCERPGQCDCL